MKYKPNDQIEIRVLLVDTTFSNIRNYGYNIIDCMTVTEHFAIHKSINEDNENYYVTHIPSGYSMTWFKTGTNFKDAIKIANDFQLVPINWDVTDPKLVIKDISDENREKIYDVSRQFY